MKDEGVRKLVEGLIEINSQDDNKSIDSEKLRAIKSAAHDIVSGVIADVVKNDVNMSPGGSTSTGQTNSAEALVARLESTGTLGLRELNLCNVLMGDAGAEAVARLISASTNIATLDLSSNTTVSLSSWRAIATALKANRTITKLALNRANITDEVVSILTDAVKFNVKLTSIELAGNRIGEKGGASILEMLKANSKISRVELWPGNHMSGQLVRQIQDMVNQAGH